MTLTNLRKKDSIRTSINYIFPLWDCCVPGIAKHPLGGSKNQRSSLWLKALDAFARVCRTRHTNAKNHPVWGSQLTVRIIKRHVGGIPSKGL